MLSELTQKPTAFWSEKIASEADEFGRAASLCCEYLEREIQPSLQKSIDRIIGRTGSVSSVFESMEIDVGGSDSRREREEALSAQELLKIALK